MNVIVISTTVLTLGYIVWLIKFIALPAIRQTKELEKELTIIQAKHKEMKEFFDNIDLEIGYSTNSSIPSTNTSNPSTNKTYPITPNSQKQLVPIYPNRPTDHQPTQTKYHQQNNTTHKNTLTPIHSTYHKAHKPIKTTANNKGNRIDHNHTATQYNPPKTPFPHHTQYHNKTKPHNSNQAQQIITLTDHSTQPRHNRQTTNKKGTLFAA